MALLKLSSIKPTIATNAQSSDLSSSVSGNLGLIESQTNLKNNDYINIRNAVKILEKYSNWNGYTKLYTEVQSNFHLGDIVYITYTEPTIDSETFNLENPSVPFADFYLGYKVLHANPYKNMVVIDRYFNDITSGKKLKNQYLSKISCRGGDYYDDVADGVVFYDCNIFNNTFAPLTGIVSGSTIAGAVINCFGVSSISDSGGSYSMNVPIGPVILNCQATGYIGRTLFLNIQENTTNVQDILMTLGSNSITISADATTICAGKTITFSVSSMIGYSDPIVSYLWKINGINVGTDNSIFAYSSFSNGDVVTCEVNDDITSSVSNSITITVQPVKNVNIHIANTPNSMFGNRCYVNLIYHIMFVATTENVCAGDVYQWYKNDIAVGTNSNTYEEIAPMELDRFYCVVTSGCLCPNVPSAQSNTVELRSRKIHITSNQASNTICSGTTVHFYATQSGFKDPIYTWKVNGVASMFIPTNNTTYSTMLSTGDIVTCECKDANDSFPADTSNPITFIVVPSSTFEVEIVNPIYIPSGGYNTIYFNPSNTSMNLEGEIQGTAYTGDTLKWYRNATLLSTTVITNPLSPTSTYTLDLPQNQDQINLVGHSTCVCNVVRDVTFSAELIAMSVQISSNNSSNLCSGSTIAFTSSLIGFIIPTYQWKRNGSNIGGATTSTYSSASLNNGDAITCVVTESPNSITSNAISVIVNKKTDFELDITQNSSLPIYNSNPPSSGDYFIPVANEDGLSISFTAIANANPTVTYSPTYQWYYIRTGVHAVNGATTTNLVWNEPLNNDTIYCKMNSNYNCINTYGPIVDSQQVRIVFKSISILYSPPNFYSSIIGFNTPIYQWFSGTTISNVATWVGATSSTSPPRSYSSGNAVQCMVTEGDVLSGDYDYFAYSEVLVYPFT